ncbi:hypothetical protein IAU60_003442 [Kwoniella sp. DSM 27419]
MLTLKSSVLGLLVLALSVSATAVPLDGRLGINKRAKVFADDGVDVLDIYHANLDSVNEYNSFWTPVMVLSKLNGQTITDRITNENAELASVNLFIEGETKGTEVHFDKGKKWPEVWWPHALEHGTMDIKYGNGDISPDIEPAEVFNLMLNLPADKVITSLQTGFSLSVLQAISANADTSPILIKADDNPDDESLLSKDKWYAIMSSVNDNTIRIYEPSMKQPENVETKVIHENISKVVYLEGFPAVPLPRDYM